MPHVTRTKINRARRLLTRKKKSIHSVFQIRRHGLLIFKNPTRTPGPALGIIRQAQTHLEGLAQRHHHPLRRIHQTREGVSLGLRKRKHPSLQRIPPGLWHEKKRYQCRRRQDPCHHRPSTVIRWRQGPIQGSRRHLRRHRLHRRLTQSRRKRIRTLKLFLQFDRTQQAIAQAWIPPRNQARQLRVTPLTPHPTVQPVRRKNRKQGNPANQNQQTQPCRRRPHAIQHEHQQKRHKQSHQPSHHRLHHLQTPQAPTKLRQPLMQRFGNRNSR